MKKNIFLLGDSISIHYNPYLIPMADGFDWMTKKGRAEALKDLDKPIGENGGTSRACLEFLRDEEARGMLNYDYLLFNCGLHDIVYEGGKTTPRVDAGDYHKNLTDIVELAQAHGVRPIWVSTTPVDDARHNVKASFLRHNEHVLLYNAIAKEVMKKHRVPIIDLYAFTAALDGELYADHVHFIDEVRRLQAEFIYHALLDATKND